MKQNGSFNDPTSSSAAVQMRILPSASSDASIGLKLDPQQAHLPDLKRRKRGTSTLVQGMDQNKWEVGRGARWGYFKRRLPTRVYHKAGTNIGLLGVL
jgi:hypothetical protein